MDLDLKSSEPLIITPTSNNNHPDKQYEENPPNSSTFVNLDFRRHRSFDRNGDVTYHRRNQTKSKMYDISQELAEVSRRLTKRKKLQTRCCLVNDIMCVLALSGIALMILTNEIYFTTLPHHQTSITWFIKLIITLSTITLICLIVYYHYLDMLLFSVNKSLQYWYVALTRPRVTQIIVEIIICAIHPFPHSFSHYNYLPSQLTHDKSTDPVPATIPLSFIPIDVALGLPMFARLYLLCRTVTFHSHFLRDSSSRSIGYLNKVSINFFFVMKAYLEQSPGFCLGTICFVIFCMGTWSFRSCNYTSTHQHLSISNSMWLFFTLFSTVGYGDLIPTTYCGRGVATLTALMGVTMTAFLITVLSQKLLLSRWEKYIYSFVLNIELAKEQQSEAANLINMEKKFLGSISAVRQIKQARSRLPDNLIGLPEMMTVQRATIEQSVLVDEKTSANVLKMTELENMLKEMKKTLHAIENKLNGT
ncbi:unnamed protein product [Adineta ricciae]|uniref:Potassium channel domain-containing protein n=1 Tax=Adineta ricciae TaxID=249248 RepID=A0A815A7T3_ADIRI|nr:unnamed protein product [Adineta ricciae]CAF1627300.1 unnamed protein product [Adineta ricciae]